MNESEVADMLASFKHFGAQAQWLPVPANAAESSEDAAASEDAGTLEPQQGATPAAKPQRGATPAANVPLPDSEQGATPAADILDPRLEQGATPAANGDTEVDGAGSYDYPSAVFVGGVLPPPCSRRAPVSTPEPAAVRDHETTDRHLKCKWLWSVSLPARIRQARGAQGSPCRVPWNGGRPRRMRFG